MCLFFFFLFLLFSLTKKIYFAPPEVTLGPVTVLYIKEGSLGGAYERNTGKFVILPPGPPSAARKDRGGVHNRGEKHCTSPQRTPYSRGNGIAAQIPLLKDMKAVLTCGEKHCTLCEQLQYTF